MGTTTWLYEGDGLIRRPTASGDPGAKPPAVDPPARGQLAQRRAEALRRLFPKLSAWMKDQVQLARMSAVERYLAQATDIYDLELRIREIDRKGLWH
jgi:hypothetical protein